MEVIQFPPTKDPLAFAGMGIKIDVEQQRENWDNTFTSAQTALRFCNFDHVRAEEAARKDAGIFNEMGSHWIESIEYLESIVEMMKVALARLESVQKVRVGANEEKGQMTPDKISRSRNYTISRSQNVLVNARAAIGRLVMFPQDLAPLNRAICQAYFNIGELIARLEAARPPANKKASATPPSPAARTKRKGK